MRELFPERPVLLIGGSGVVGTLAAKTLRRLQPQLPIVIGGRNLARAEAVAGQLGHASVQAIDLGRPDLGVPDAAQYAAMALFVKDDSLNSLVYAQLHGVPYLSISDGAFEIAPTVARYIHSPSSAPVLMGSQWLVGAATLPALHFAGELDSVDAIHIGLLLDDEDMGGPAAFVDYERITGVAPRALILEDGKFTWADETGATRHFNSVDGRTLEAKAYSPLDVVSLAAATNARSIRLDLAMGESSSRRRGEPYSTEIVLEIEGLTKTGAAHRARYEIVHPGGQAPLTALGVAVGLERLLGLSGGAPVKPGLYLPEVLIDPAYMVARMEEIGTRIRCA